MELEGLGIDPEKTTGVNVGDKFAYNKDCFTCYACNFEPEVGGDLDLVICRECNNIKGHQCMQCHTFIPLPTKCLHYRTKKITRDTEATILAGPIPCECKGDCKRYLIQLPNGGEQGWLCETKFDRLEKN